MSQKLTVLSVIIPCYNDATYVKRLLQALTKQQFDNFEVIVSDANSKDIISEVVESFKDSLDVTLVQSPPAGSGVGRNEGATRAKGDWLLFLDADDDMDDPLFMQKLVNGAEAKGWNTASAKIMHSDAKWYEQLGSTLNYKYIKFLAHTKHPVAPGWCILTKRSVFELVGGFDPDIRLGEDYDYVIRASRHGGFGFVEEAYYYVDLRRPREEGFSLFIKGTANEIYRHTHRYKIKKNRFKYDFGTHKARED